MCLSTAVYAASRLAASTPSSGDTGIAAKEGEKIEGRVAVIVKDAGDWDMWDNRRIETILLKIGAWVVKVTRRNIIQSCNIRAARGSGL